MPQYRYAKKGGGFGDPFEAADPVAAQAIADKATDVIPRSGVALYTPPVPRYTGGGAFDKGDGGGGQDVDFDLSDAEKAEKERIEELKGGKRTTLSAAEEKDIFARETTLQQARIDAINKFFDTEVAGIRERGEELQGSVRAINVRAGLPGSDFATASRIGLEEKTQAVVDAKNAERELRISGIFAMIDQNARQRVELENERARLNQAEYLDRLGEFETKGRSRFAELAALGIDFDALDDDDREKLLQMTGYGEEEARFRFAKIRQEATKAKVERFTSGGNIVELEIDPLTDKIIGRKTYSAADLGLPVNRDLGFITNDLTGELFYYDKDNPEGGVTKFGEVGPSPPREVIYTDKDIPGELRQSVLDTLADKEGAKKLGKELTLANMMTLFPEVNRETLQSYMDEFYDYETLIADGEEGDDNKEWWQFWK